MPVTINGSAGVTTNTGAVYNGLQTGTAVTASGTSVDFTSIPSWVKRITVMLAGVSTNGTSNYLVQLGDSGGIETTGYLGSGSGGGGSIGSTNYTTGFGLRLSDAGSPVSGILTIASITGNTWAASGVFGIDNSGYFLFTAGQKPLSATLDRLRITTVNGTDTFDAGTINIIYE